VFSINANNEDISWQILKNTNVGKVIETKDDEEINQISKRSRATLIK
jgi:hypothetical protein